MRRVKGIESLTMLLLVAQNPEAEGDRERHSVIFDVIYYFYLGSSRSLVTVETRESKTANRDRIKIII
jgi:hypothetical protein